MSIMELYMKELLMQQKLGHELQQIQQQQQKAPFSYNNQQQFLQTPSSAFSRPVKQQQQSTMFSPKSTFLQQCPPPAMFDPLAAAVAANFMQQSPFANTFGMGQQQQQQGIYGMGMGSQQQMQMMAASPYFGFGGFPFSDFTQSPSFALNSTGSCASLDSFPSSGLPSSPDSSSCSSTLNGPFPLAGRPQQIQRAKAPTDFSELAAGGNNSRKRAFNAAGNGTNMAAIARQNGSHPQQRQQQQSEMTFPMAKQPIFPNAVNTNNKNGKKPSVDSAKANAAVRSTRPNATAVASVDSAQHEPPKKMARKLGTTIFVPLDFSAVGKQVRKPSAAATQPAKNNSSTRDEKSAKTSTIPRTTTSQSVSAITTTLDDVEAMLAETMAPKSEAKFVEMSKKMGSEEEKPLEAMEIGKNEELMKKQKSFENGELFGEQKQKDSSLLGNGLKKSSELHQQQQKQYTKTKVPLTTTALNLTIKCEPLEKHELQEQALFGELPPEDAFLLPDEPPTLTPVEKENAGQKKALKKRKKLVKRGELEKRKKNGKMTKPMKEKKVERRGRKKKVVQPLKKEEVKEQKCQKLDEPTSIEQSPSTITPENCQIPPETEATEEEEETTKQEEELNTSLEEDDDDEEPNDEEAEKLEADDAANASSSQNQFFCRWTKCRERFADDDLLFDHLSTAHIEPLKKWVLAEQRELEQQKKTGLKRRRSNGGDKDKTVKERFRCRWTKCEQFPRRGDAQKKLDWLLKHLVIRHAPKARPFSCIFAGCPLRFPKLQALNDHLRSAHDDNTGRGNGRKSGGAEETKISCFEFRPCVRLPIVRDCIDARTVEWVRRRMRMAATEANEQLETPTSSCSSSSSTHGEQLALEQYRTLEFDEKKAEKMENKRESTVAAGNVAPRMMLQETIGQLKALFSHKHKVKVPLRTKH